jgi:hypothetical protein
MATPFVSTTEANTFTDRNLRKTLIDLQYQSATMMGILRGKKRVVLEDGGSIISQPILVQKNTTAMTYSGSDVLDASLQEEVSNYELQWKQATVAVTINGLDKARNAGRNRNLDLIKNKQTTALMALFDKMATMVFGNGTTNYNKDWDGFGAGINNAAGFEVYLGIDRIANPYWQAQILNPGVPTALSVNSMMSLFMATRTDTEVIDVISTTKAAYTLYWSSLVANERYVDDSIGNLGFSNIAFQGKAVVEDSHNPQGEMWFWNLDMCRLVLHRDMAFKFSGFEEPVSQDLMIGRWKVYGNYECKKPPSCGRYLNILNG